MLLDNWEITCLPSGQFIHKLLKPSITSVKGFVSKRALLVSFELTAANGITQTQAEFATI